MTAYGLYTTTGMLFMGYVRNLCIPQLVCLHAYKFSVWHFHRTPGSTQLLSFVRIQRYILCHYYRKWMVVLWWEFLSACNPVYSNSNPGGYGTFFEL